MGACLSAQHHPATLTAVSSHEQALTASGTPGEAKHLQKDGVDGSDGRTPTPTSTSASIPFLAVDAKGRVTAASTPSPAALAALTAIPERDVRMLLPPDPPMASPSGAPLAGPALVARRGRSWAVGLEGVRGVVMRDRVVLLAGPASVLGALDSAGRAPEAEDAFVVGLASQVAAAARGDDSSSTPLQVAALDAMVEAVCAALESRSDALSADAAAAGDALCAAVAGRGGGGAGSLGAGFCCCCAAPPPAAHPPGGPAARLRRVKGEVADVEAAARRVAAALARRRGRQQGRGEVASILAAAAARAGGAGGLTGQASHAARAAEAAARMALRRRVLACGGA